MKETQRLIFEHLKELVPNLNLTISYGDSVIANDDMVSVLDLTGTVKRINRKTISVTPDGAMFGKYWRVSPSMLNKANEMPKTLIDDRTIEPKPIEEPIEDTAEENHDLICGLMDGMIKYAINDSLSMSGIVKCMWVNGIKNTDENRKIALDYVKNELNLKIR